MATGTYPSTYKFVIGIMMNLLNATTSTLVCNLQSQHAAKLQQLSFAHFELSKFDIRSIKCPLTPGLGMNFAHDV